MSKTNLKCLETNSKLGPIPQHIIYHFNEKEVRNKIITESIRENRKQDEYTYLGTFNIQDETRGSSTKQNQPVDVVVTSPFEFSLWFDDKLQSKDTSEEQKRQIRKLKSHSNFGKIQENAYGRELLNDFIKAYKSLFEKRPKTIFTVCYHYKEANVHFVSFLYLKENKELYSFDPGVGLYEEGQDILVPKIVESFQKSALLPPSGSNNHLELGKMCPKFRYIFRNEPIGIQYNGKTKDAFCQTWTLYYLVQTIQDQTIVKKLCQKHPANREVYLFKEFIIPILEKNPDYVQKIYLSTHVSEGRLNINLDQIIPTLKQYTTDCKTNICSKGRQNQQQGLYCTVNQIKV